MISFSSQNSSQCTITHRLPSLDDRGFSPCVSISTTFSQNHTLRMHPTYSEAYQELLKLLTKVFTQVNPRLCIEILSRARKCLLESQLHWGVWMLHLLLKLE